MAAGAGERVQTDSVTTVWTLKQEDGDKHTVSGVYTSRPM